MNCIAELIANIILALSGTILVIFISRLIAGLFKTNVSVGTAYIADITDEKNRAKGMGMFGVAFGLGFTIGPLVGGLIAGSNFTLDSLHNVAWFACFINLINLLYVFFFLDESLIEKKDYRISYSFEKFRSQINIVTNQKPTSFFFSNILYSFNFFRNGRNYSNLGTGNLCLGTKRNRIYHVTCWAYSNFSSRSVVKSVIKIFNEIIIIRSGYISLILGFFIIPFSNLYFMPIAVILLCYGIGVSNPCLNSLISKNATPNSEGLPMGSAYSSQAAARFLGQPLAGLMFLYLGKNYHFYFDVIFLSLLALFYFFINLNRTKTL